MRAFIAIEIPEHIQNQIVETRQILRRTRLKISWTKPENIHLTLKFLGEVIEDNAANIKTALDEIATRHSPFSITVAGAGGFPIAQSPRVLWIACEELSGKLAELQLEIEAAVEPLGFPAEKRDFVAHLTLGRIRFPRPDPALTSALESIKNKSFGTVQVNEVCLFQSQLHPDGAIYTKLSSHPLRCRH